MRPPADLIDDVEIVEPPLQELTRKGSFFKRTCLTGCGCVVVIIIAIIIGIYLFLGKGPDELKSIPDYFPDTIPLYDKDAIEKITLIPGKYEKRSIELALFFPKIILAPLSDDSLENTTSSAQAILNSQMNSIKKLWSVAATPDEDYTNTVKIEWRDVSADPQFIFSYYKNELTKNNYHVKIEDENPLQPQFSFSYKEISGTFIAYKDAGKKGGTSHAILKVILPLKTTFLNENTSTQSSSSPQLLPQTHDEIFTPSL